MASVDTSEIPHVGTFAHRPILPPATHPVETGRYILVTRMIEELAEKASAWVKHRVTGAIIPGLQRMGKTRARWHLSRALPAEFPGLPVFQVPCRKTKTPSEDSFFGYLLSSCGHADPQSGRAPAKRDRLREFLTEKGLRSEQNRVLMMIDDAQHLAELQYGWLAEVHNELQEQGVDMVVLLFGQRELVHQRSAFQVAEKRQIIGRFMIHEFPFHGLLDRADVERSLRGYDDESDYPANSGWSFTRYYFPDAFAEGWRLTSIASDLWDVFMEVTREHNLSRYEEVPMLHFCATVNAILTTIGPTAGVRPKISRQKLHELVKASGYLEFQKHGGERKIAEED